MAPMTRRRAAAEREARENADWLSQIPAEMLVEVIKPLAFLDRLALAKTCRRLRDVVAPSTRRFQSISVKGSLPVEYYMLDVHVDDTFRIRQQVSSAGSHVELRTIRVIHGKVFEDVHYLPVKYPHKKFVSLIESVLGTAEYCDELHIGCDRFASSLEKFYGRVNTLSLTLFDDFQSVLVRLQPRSITLFDSDFFPMLRTCRLPLAELKGLEELHLFTSGVSVDFDELIQSSLVVLASSYTDKLGLSPTELDKILQLWMAGERSWKRLRLLSPRRDTFAKSCFPLAEEDGYPRAFPSNSPPPIVNANGERAYILHDVEQLCFKLAEPDELQTESSPQKQHDHEDGDDDDDDDRDHNEDLDDAAEEADDEDDNRR